MTVRDALREGVAALGASGSPFLDASLLLASALGVDRTRLYACGPESLESGAAARYRDLLAQRVSGLPVAYILGAREFWGRRFRTDSRALVPRPETELLVSLALEAGDALVSSGRRARPRVHEICCGSGCVILSLAADRPLWQVSASDLSPGAGSLARENAELLLPRDRPGGPCELFASDLLDSVEGPFDIVLANPPYIPTAELELLAPGLAFEPRMALDGGPDGLDLYRRLVPAAASKLEPGGVLLLESDGSQAPILRSLLAGEGFGQVASYRDLAGIERITRGSLPCPD